MLDYMITRAKELHQTIKEVIADCESGEMAGMLGTAAMFKDNTPHCVLGHIAHRNKGIPQLVLHRNGHVPFIITAEPSQVIAANDSADRTTRHSAVIPALKAWDAELARWIDAATKEAARLG